MWPSKIRHKLELQFHPVVYPLSKAETEEMMNWWGPCASFRLFLPVIFLFPDGCSCRLSNSDFLATISLIQSYCVGTLFKKFEEKVLKTFTLIVVFYISYHIQIPKTFLLSTFLRLLDTLCNANFLFFCFK